MYMILCMSMQIFHIVVMIFMLRIQDDIEIAGTQAGFVYIGNPDGIAGEWEAGKMACQHLAAGTEIEQCAHRHITADPGITFKI
jgi:hypothetical protein